MFNIIKYKRKKVTEYNFPSGFKEIIIHEAITNKEGNKKGRKGNKADDVNIQQRQINICRIKKNMRRYALYNNLTRMITINTKENIKSYDVDRFDYYFKQLLKYLKREYPKYKKLKYLGTRELQKRGAIHLHILVDMYIPQDLLNKLWNEIAGKGHVDIRYKGIKAVNYVIKYLEKQLNDNNFKTKNGHSKKAYFASKNLNKDLTPIKREWSFTVRVDREGKEKPLKDYGWYNIILDELKEYKQAEKILYDSVTEYRINGEVRQCRSILIQL